MAKRKTKRKAGKTKKELEAELAELRASISSGDVEVVAPRKKATAHGRTPEDTGKHFGSRNMLVARRQAAAIEARAEALRKKEGKLSAADMEKALEQRDILIDELRDKVDALLEK